MLRKVVTKMIPWPNFLLKVTPVTPVAMNNLGCGGLDDHACWVTDHGTSLRTIASEATRKPVESKSYAFFSRFPSSLTYKNERRKIMGI